MRFFNHSIVVLLAVGLAVLIDCPRAHAEKIRQPVREGQFYPADPAELTEMIGRLTREAGKTKAWIPRNKELKALIMPHAGYIYSGCPTAHAAGVLKKSRLTKVVLLGPDHFIWR